MARKPKKSKSTKYQAIESSGDLRVNLAKAKSLVGFTQDLLRGQPTGPFLAHVKAVKYECPDKSEKTSQKNANIAPRVEYLATGIRKAVVQFLLQNGGFRKINVVCRRKRNLARLYDPAVWPHLSLSLTSFSLEALVFAYKEGGRRSWKKLIPGEHSGELGDEIFTTLLLEHLCSGPADWTSLFNNTSGPKGPVARLPFSRFLRPSLGYPSPADVDYLQAPNWILALCYLDRFVAKKWFDEELLRRTRVPQDSLADYASFGEFLTLWVDSAMKKDRKDLLFPVIEYFVRALEHDKTSNHLIKMLEKLVRAKVHAASQQQQFLSVVGIIYKLGERLTCAYEEAVDLAFIERSPADHVFMAQYHKRFAPIADEVRVIGRHLSGELG